MSDAPQFLTVEARNLVQGSLCRKCYARLNAVQVNDQGTKTKWEVTCYECGNNRYFVRAEDAETLRLARKSEAMEAWRNLIIAGILPSETKTKEQYLDELGF